MMQLFKSNQKSFCAAFITQIVSWDLILEPCYYSNVNEKKCRVTLRIQVLFTACHEKRQFFIYKQRKVIYWLKAYDSAFQQKHTNHLYVINQ